MSTTTSVHRHYATQSKFRKFTLNEYHKLIELSVVREGEPFELLEGNLMRKMPRGPRHDSTIDLLEGVLLGVLPSSCYARLAKAVTLTDSEPEPDIAVVSGPRQRYGAKHPTPADVRLIVEVSASSLMIDRHDKGSIYALARIPVYWVVNVVDKVIEVYTQPGGTGEAAAYTKRDDFPIGTTVPVVLDGNTVGSISVSDVFG